MRVFPHVKVPRLGWAGASRSQVLHSMELCSAEGAAVPFLAGGRPRCLCRLCAVRSRMLPVGHRSGWRSVGGRSGIRVLPSSLGQLFLAADLEPQLGEQTLVVRSEVSLLNAPHGRRSAGCCLTNGRSALHTMMPLRAVYARRTRIDRPVGSRSKTPENSRP